MWRTPIMLGWKRSQHGLDEEKILISRQLNILHSNLFKMIKPCLKENETRGMFLRILFKILADNRNENTLSQGSTDQTFGPSCGPIVVRRWVTDESLIPIESAQMHTIRLILYKSPWLIAYDSHWLKLSGNPCVRCIIKTIIRTQNLAKLVFRWSKSLFCIF